MTPSLNIPDLAGKAVLITGASTGIGAELARAFAAQGALVGLHYNASFEAAKALADEITAAKGRVHLIHADMSTGAGSRSAVDQAVAAFGRLDGLINNAGGMVRRVSYENATEKDYELRRKMTAGLSSTPPRSRRATGLRAGRGCMGLPRLLCMT